MVRHIALKGLYDLEKTIGCGGFAKVKLATHIATGEKVAIKIIDKSCIGYDISRVKLELDALRTLSHPHICKLYQVIETDTHFFIVVDYCSGGELFDHIVQRQRVSECQSRKFFKQIVSAVGYLHNMGYAHRDLKPENVLLDKNENLKIIDFGLCAKPNGGMACLLNTSCGSPTYAAPELVTGLDYHGSAVDVWALGVLLYALLCGFLPFDDNNISSLYKKISKGQYEEPSWLSRDSKAVIKLMLQVNPDQRITLLELAKHEWLNPFATGKPVNFEAPSIYKHRDEQCVSLMANAKGTSSNEMWNHIRKWRYDYDTATYLILISRKSNNLPLKISLYPKLQFKRSLNPTPTNTKKKRDKILLPPAKLEQALAANSDSRSIKSDDNCLNLGSPSRKPMKRPHSPDLENNSTGAVKYTPGKTFVESQQGVSTPSDKSNENTSSARKVLGSIERSINRVRHVLTPRKKKLDSASSEAPVVLSAKSLCNVSITTAVDPDFILNKLREAMELRKITYRQKGYILRGKTEPATKVANSKIPVLQCSLKYCCSFELEVCMIPTQAVAGRGGARVAIRRKRLTGDGWGYKRVCEDILALATSFSGDEAGPSTSTSPNTESPMPSTSTRGPATH